MLDFAGEVVHKIKNGASVGQPPGLSESKNRQHIIKAWYLWTGAGTDIREVLTLW